MPVALAIILIGLDLYLGLPRPPARIVSMHVKANFKKIRTFHYAYFKRLTSPQQMHTAKAVCFQLKPKSNHTLDQKALCPDIVDSISTGQLTSAVERQPLQPVIRTRQTSTQTLLLYSPIKCNTTHTHTRMPHLHAYSRLARLYD